MSDYNPKLPFGTSVTRTKDNGEIEYGIVYMCYGDLPHSAVKVHNVFNCTTGEISERPYTWLLGEIEVVHDVTEIVNPLPFEDT